MFNRVGDSWVSTSQALFSFLYFRASPTVISKIPLSRGTYRQNKHRKTNLNNMAVILKVLILFSTVLTALNFDFSKASFINRYGHYRCTAHHTTQTGDGKPVLKAFFRWNPAVLLFRKTCHSEHRRGYQSKLFLITRRVSVVTVYVRFAEMTGDRHYSERAHFRYFFLYFCIHFFCISYVWLQTAIKDKD